MLALIGFLFRHFKGYYLLVAFAITMALVQVVADLLTPIPFKFLSDKIQKGTTPVFLNGPLSLFDRFILNIKPAVNDQHSLLSLILFAAVAVVLCGALSAILSSFQLYVAAFMGQHLSAQLRGQLFEHLQRLSLGWHGQQKKGDLVQRITGDIFSIEKFVTDGLIDLFAGPLTLVGVIVIMFLLNARFTLLAIAIAPVLAAVVFGYTRAIKAATRRAARIVGEVANVATENIGAITIIKAFTREEKEVQRFTHYISQNHAAGMRAGSLQAQFTPLVTILVSIGTAIIIGIGAFIAGNHDFSFLGLTVAKGSLSIGDLTIFLLYLKLLYQPMRDLSKLTIVATRAAAGAERIQEVFDQVPEVQEGAVSYHSPQKLQGEISYENVIFSYVPGYPVLRGINFHIAAGEKVAIVGVSGSGKSTLVNLPPRFYEVQQGIVKLDGVDARMYPLAILRQNVSMVLQDSVLLEGTIRDNVEVGRPGADDAEIVDAAKKAQIHEMILGLPDGYDTLVHEQGKNFSGGQRQRLAIARAILRDSPILILDEPTANLDVEAEAEVMSALNKLVVGRTVLMVSHRLHILSAVDQIIVLRDGQIVERGTFQDLKRWGGAFAHLLVRNL
ncbi:MAG TPA: ABC transporter ATP-binding protein [Ktedonobacteraceae bacterium]|nr:ABC transporter ATP-binding protein [Ktedonobacteraceae bacterium]